MQLEEAKRPPVELELDDGNTQTSSTHVIASTHSEKTVESYGHELTEIENSMKAEAFHWPRLVLPPLKKSGHVLMDVCDPSGMWPSVYVAVCQPTSEYRQDFAYDRPEVPREAAVLRCPQVFLG
jgi:ribosomal protein RSM22 (predicted rRNA methylase)